MSPETDFFIRQTGVTPFFRIRQSNLLDPQTGAPEQLIRRLGAVWLMTGQGIDVFPDEDHVPVDSDQVFPAVFCCFGLCVCYVLVEWDIRAFQE